jgi:FKBP-type peptidyl-prolyl cis-trans isomerase
MTRNNWIAAAAGVALVAFFLYGSVLMNFFKNPNPQPMTQQSGVIIEDIVVGEGESAQPGDTITVDYVGTLQSGQVFDSSKDRNQPFTLTLGQGGVIRGWEEGLVGMKEGGTRKLTISPEYGYGSNAYGPIPANSTLIFEVELKDVTKAAVQ